MFARNLMTAGLLLALSAPAVLAKPDKGPHFPPEYDLNGDGSVTSDEVTTARTAEFTAMDTDASGYASIAEIEAWLTAKQTERFTALDSDESSALSQAEFVGSATGKQARRAAKAFKIGDTDQNGELSSAEFAALRPVSQDLIRLLAAVDTDDDDQISLAEYLAEPAKPGR